MITADYQVQYNGLVIGTDDYEVVTFDGLTMPDVRTSDVNRPQADGMFAGQDYLSGRVFTLSIEIWHTSTVSLGDRINEIFAAFTPRSANDFIVQVPGLGQVKCSARVRKRRGPVFDENTPHGKALMQFEFFATDPRWYAVNSQAAFFGLTSQSGGAQFPMQFPLQFNETNVGPLTATNRGTYETGPIIIIAGPITDPSLENVTVGKELEFTGTLATASDQLWVDFKNRTVLLNNSADRTSWINDSREWWMLQPGENEIKLNGSPGAGTPLGLATWNDAWV